MNQKNESKTTLEMTLERKMIKKNQVRISFYTHTFKILARENAIREGTLSVYYCLARDLAAYTDGEKVFDPRCLACIFLTQGCLDASILDTIFCLENKIV